MNHVLLVGRITHDLQLRTTSTGKSVLNFSLAVPQSFSQDDRADFLPCVAWNTTAENTAKYCEKGTLVAVSGKLSRRTYENDKGHHSVMEVIVSDIRFYGKGKRNEVPPQFTIPAMQAPIAP